MKKIRMLALLLCVLMVTSVAMTACTEETPACTSHVDANGDGKCDTCQVAMPDASVPGSSSSVGPAAPVSVELSITIKNNYGVNTKAQLTIRNKATKETVTVSTDDNGSVKVTLVEGEYTVAFDELPEYHLSGDQDLTVTAGMSAVTLEVEDNTPNGTADKPFTLLDDNFLGTMNANGEWWFQIRAGEGRVIAINNPFVEVTYNDQVFTPDASGHLEFHIVSDNPMEFVKFSVTNKSSSERDLELILAADQGTMDNPYVVESLDTPITITATPGESVYFKWTASQAGTLTLMCSNPKNDISMYNIHTYVSTGFSNGAESISVDVGLHEDENGLMVGDVVEIDVGCMDSEVPVELVFTLVFTPAAE